VIERRIAVNTHGRYLVVPPAEDVSAGLLVGFHGYAEGAESQLERLRAIPGSDRWMLVAIQGLHRFYQRRTNEVIASWMTRQDRDVAIADNLAYVEGVLDEVSREYPHVPRLVFAGFSQGVAMAFRAACATTRRVDGVIAVGGDVPPEIDPASLAHVQTALVCRGARDEWYSDEKFQQDVARIRQAGAAVRPVAFDGGHEWSAAAFEASSAFLRDVMERRR
jgi:predicted esterase